jgi:hypothetical protein
MATHSPNTFLNPPCCAGLGSEYLISSLGMGVLGVYSLATGG